VRPYSLAEIEDALQTNWPCTLYNHEAVQWDVYNITFSIPDLPPDDSDIWSHESWGWVPIPYQQQQLTKEAFALWDDLIDRNLVQSDQTNANITFAYTTNNQIGTGDMSAYTSLSVEDIVGDNTITDADIWIEADKIDPASVNYGSAGFSATVHEIGHALGLSHPGQYNGGTPSYSCLAARRSRPCRPPCQAACSRRKSI
jgi:matrixin